MVERYHWLLVIFYVYLIQTASSSLGPLQAPFVKLTTVNVLVPKELPLELPSMKYILVANGQKVQLRGSMVTVLVQLPVQPHQAHLTPLQNVMFIVSELLVLL
jgi:hypothetical protein